MVLNTKQSVSQHAMNELHKFLIYLEIYDGLLVWLYVLVQQMPVNARDCYVTSIVGDVNIYLFVCCIDINREVIKS